MRFLRLCLRTAAVAACLGGAPAGVLAQAAPVAPALWRLATGYRAESFQTRNLQQFAADAGLASGGALRIAVLPDGALFKLREIFPAVEAGKAEAGEALLSAVASAVPVAGADAVPFIVSTYADARRLWTAQRPLLALHFARKGLRLLYAVPWPPQGLYAARPIHGTADLRGTRMRTFDPTTQRIAELVGAQPVDVAMVDLSAALARGGIDDMITSAATGSETQAWSRMRYYYSINAFFPKNAVFVNAASYAALPETLRTAVDRAAEAAETRGWEMSQAQELASTTELKARGITVERPSPELEAELKRLGERFSREWVGSVGHDANAILVPYYFN